MHHLRQFLGPAGRLLDTCMRYAHPRCDAVARTLPECCIFNHPRTSAWTSLIAKVKVPFITRHRQSPVQAFLG